MSITPEQCRGARGLLDFTQIELGARAGVGRSTVQDFETGKRTPTPANLTAIRHVLEQAGVEFISQGDHKGPGVRLRDPLPGAGRERSR